MANTKTKIKVQHKKTINTPSNNNIFYAQSGGVTAVINATACGLIETARRHPKLFGKVFAGLNGINGALQEELIDTSVMSTKEVRALKYTPAGAFGSCRYKLKDAATHPEDYYRILAVFKAHRIGYFFYNGGNDSQDTADKLAKFSAEIDYPLHCIGLPKTVDNDLLHTDNCPGFASVAKYVAIATREAGLDVASMCANSTKVFILEVMGRHAGWIAAASGLTKLQKQDPPHIILFPEVIFEPEKFLATVQETVEKYGYCVIVASEGIRNAHHEFLAETGTRDAFGHSQLGGVAPYLANLVNEKLGLKNHWAVADYLQRAARHIASEVDVEQAYELGREAIRYAKLGIKNVMLTIVRSKSKSYAWSIDNVALSAVANGEKKLPKHYIDKTGYMITKQCRDYLSPLIQGEAYPPYQDGLPHYLSIKHKLVSKKLPKHTAK